MWLSHFFIKKAATAVLKSCKMLLSKWNRRKKEEKLPSYCEVVCYLLETYAAEDIIAELDIEILCFSQLSNMTSTDAEAILNKKICCDRGSYEYVLKGIFIESYMDRFITASAQIRAERRRLRSMTLHVT